MNFRALVTGKADEPGLARTSCLDFCADCAIFFKDAVGIVHPHDFMELQQIQM